MLKVTLCLNSFSERLELGISGHSINVLSVTLVINSYLFIAVLGLRCYPGFPLIALSGGLLSGCGAWISHCGGPSF